MVTYFFPLRDAYVFVEVSAAGRRGMKGRCSRIAFMLPARGTMQGRLRGLHGGADDYLKMPFDFE